MYNHLKGRFYCRLVVTATMLFSTILLVGMSQSSKVEAASTVTIPSKSQSATDSNSSSQSSLSSSSSITSTSQSDAIKTSSSVKTTTDTKTSSTTLPDIQSDPSTNVTKTKAGYTLQNSKFKVEIGGSGEIDGLYLQNDAFDTNYVMNTKDNPKQNNAAHEWMGELMFRTKTGDANASMPWEKEYTSQTPVSTRHISLNGKTVQVTYDPTSNANGKNDGIKNLQIVETYTLDNSGHLHWNINLKNPTKQTITVGDFGLPMPFREFWHYTPAKGKSQLDMAYENSVVYHSFVGQNSSYIYATRPSGIGNFLTFTPDSSTDAKLEYQDHWEDDGTHKGDELAWAMPKFGADVTKYGWDNGLNVFYVNSAAIAPGGNRGYLPSTDTVLAPGASKNYAFNFSAADIKNAATNSTSSSSSSTSSSDSTSTTNTSSSNSSSTKSNSSVTVNGDMTDTKYEKQLKDILYNEGLVDAVSVPSMVLTKGSDGVARGQMYLHTKVPQDQIKLSFQNQHDDQVSKQTVKQDKIDASGVSNDHGQATYKKTVTKDGQNYYVYDISFTSDGRNNIIVNYQQNGQPKQTTLQYDVLENPSKSLEKHAQFMLKTQIKNSGKFNDQIFDDWSMDKKATVNDFTTRYGGWGDDWGLTHGLFLADMNTRQPNKDQIQALDNYIYTGLWTNLMRAHHGDYGVPDWLRATNDDLSYTWRSYSYVHVYNTFFEMYKIAKANLDLIKYNVKNYPVYKADPAKYQKNPANVYLQMAYNILKACYTNSGIKYKDDGLMGESTTPQIIKSLKAEGMTDEATNVQKWMKEKYETYTSQKYPFGSEMNYDNTGEESVYMLGNMFSDKRLMSMADMKTRADRGVQPLWYQYGVPVTIDGENWWQFQYTTSLADIGMNNWLVSQANGLSQDQKGLAERANYAAKLGNLTQINTGQIDTDKDNDGAVSWTYQAELGNNPQPNQNSIAKTGAGDLHNGWRQTSGEGDLALFGALQVLSADVANDPIFGLVGYGATVTDSGSNYDITPTDGMYQRLNLINDQLAYEFTADQYTHAIISKDHHSATFSVKNVAKQAHTLQLTITNPNPDGATYDILWNGKQVGTVKEDQKTTEVKAPIDANDGQLQIVKQGTEGNSNNSVNSTNSSNNSSTSSSSSATTSSSSSSTTSSNTNSSSSTSSSTSTSSEEQQPAKENSVPKSAHKIGSTIHAVKKLNLYKSATFKKSARIASYGKHVRTNRPKFMVTGYARSENGVLRYQVRDANKGTKNYGKKGYITANKRFTQSMYYATMPKSKKITVISKKGINAYKYVSLKGKAKHYKKGTHLRVKKLVKYHSTTRYQLSNGHYITGNKELVIQQGR
ncbi:DUF5695 domain-containing protein [Lentilactobacillus raoultii]|uniref:DUF5695 domain-containing protein n=1 Tax=Lentilactobacillus raoultii TaxID=1987503 RepID=A0ABW3PDH9_9LACO|nr:DUF5695 domain-containing protein [Lentilactobacillus raoultii]